MNPRIQELAQQATEDILGVRVLNQQQFAELIVRECAGIAARTPCPYTDEYMIKQLGHTWDMACAESAKEIRQRFGITG